MNTEEKAKAYDEALERAKNWIKDGSEPSTKKCLELLFPELKESEDERIKNGLIRHLKELRDWKCDTMPPIKIPSHYDAWIAYLEKQKEKLNYLSVNRVKVRPDGGTERYTIGYLEKQEQKPNYCHYGGDPNVERCKYCSAACSARLTEEQKPAWSEEDEKLIRLIISILEAKHPKGFWRSNEMESGVYTEELVDFLKRLRPYWKPSEWQMKALERTIHIANFGLEVDRRKALESLYEELKKL